MVEEHWRVVVDLAISVAAASVVVGLYREWRGRRVRKED